MMMTARLRTFRLAIDRRAWRRTAETTVQASAAPQSAPLPAPAIDIAPNDPLIAYFQSASGAVDVDALELDSPALTELRAAGVKLIVPLVSQGELIGMLNLGPRLSEQGYSADDRKLLNNLAAQAAPAVRVAQLVKEQEAEARERERIAQELRIAQLIQQQFLPKELPQLPGWEVAALYQPAREVGGDFYDFFDLPDGQVGIVVGDVTDKGVPAALVMATTRSLLRSDAPRLVSPADVLAFANELLLPSIPDHMFVTCLYVVLDPHSGRLRYANAGHNLPYVRAADAVLEMRATGLPLGLMPGITYEERESTLQPGQSLLLYSDGLIEAHNEQGEMFGFPRLLELMRAPRDSQDLIDHLMSELDRFTGPQHEQEDDITLVALRWNSSSSQSVHLESPVEQGGSMPEGGGRVVADFTLASEPGNERLAIERVAAAIAPLTLAPATVERLKTAVGEATMNAIEHGNQFRSEAPVEIRVVVRESSLSVAITDQGGEQTIPIQEAPDIDLKLAGLQTPRGGGLFLIANMVDEMLQSSDGVRHTLELIVFLKRDEDAGTTV
jgi:serine phosphatase RsbU (regulator of sigma subunit)/anti-sigma regulatory factor (Ser/Thr protein kinase)